MTHYTYDFVDRWMIPADKPVVEAALMDYEHWAEWWDGLEHVDHLTDSVGPGAKFLCTWRGAAWYKLHLEMTITNYQPGAEFGFDASGDLSGSGRFYYEAAGSRLTAIIIHWNVRTNKWWMNAFGWLLRPLFIRNHDRIMKAGETGLVRFIMQQGEIHGKEA